MLPLDIPRSNPPSWIDELRLAILWPNKHWASSESINLVLAGTELEAWLHEQRDYDGQHKQGWLSVIADFRKSSERIGSELEAILANDLSDTIVAMNSLESDISSKSSAQLKVYLPTRLTADRAAYDRLKGRWIQADVRDAAWRDFVEACRDPDTRYETLATYRDLFYHVVRTSDYEPEEISRLLASILSGSSLYVTQARVWLGDIQESQVSWPYQDTDAGLSDDELLALCSRIITTTPELGHHIVWLAFNHTGLGGADVEIGPVSFWNCEVVRNILETRGPNLARLPAEIRDMRYFKYSDLPTDRDVMLARIDLGKGAFTDPVRVALEQAEAVVALAGFHIGDSRWQRIEGHISFVDGRIRSTGTFYVPQHEDLPPNGLYADRMNAELAELATQLPQHLPMSDPGLTEVVGAVRWWQRACAETPLTALLLHVRVLELIAARIGIRRWYDYADTHLRTIWIHLYMRNQLFQLAWEAVHSHGPLITEADRQKFQTMMSGHGSTSKVDLAKGLAALPEFVRVFPPHSSIGRRARTLSKRFDSIASLLAWRDELASEWDLVEGRLRRLRNALAHGGPLQEGTAETVHGFARQLAGWSLSLTLESVLEGKAVMVGHNEHEQRETVWWHSFATASTVADVLFRP